MRLILASASETRAKMLRDAGVIADAMASDVDEPALKRLFREKGRSALYLADALAEAKARAVSAFYPDALVIGADQVLAYEGETFDKPRSRAEAAAQIRRLRGQTHELLSAAVLMRDDQPLWRGTGTARLTMRDFSDDFLDAYLAEEGDAVLWTVGGYRIEGRGALLFDRIEGDYFSILGLPLLQVIAALREEGIVKT